MSFTHLLRSLKPNQIHNNIAEVDFAALHASGKKYLLSDVDNTLAKRKSETVPKQILSHLNQAIAAGHIEGIVLISNIIFESSERRQRVATIATLLKCECHCAVAPQAKPHPEAYRAGLQLLPPDATVDNTAMIGDQLFTDILGANKLGLYTIYVNPLGKEAWYTSYKRPLENLVFRLTKWRQS